MTEQEKIETLTAYATNLLQQILNPQTRDDAVATLYEALKDNDKFFETEQAAWRERLVKADETHAAQIERLQTEAAEIKSKLAELPEPRVKAE